MKRGGTLVGLGIVLATANANSASPADCAELDVEYALAGTLRLADTPYNLANGSHKVGPGTMVLRYEPNGRVTIRSYSMQQSFTIVIHAFFSTMTVTASTMTRAAPNAAGVIAEGILKNGEIQWTSRARSVRTDGQLFCSGTYCGSFGAPAPGKSTVKVGPEDALVRPFSLSSNGRSFTMPFTLATRTESPKQTSFLALTGREVRRTCAATAPLSSR